MRTRSTHNGLLFAVVLTGLLAASATAGAETGSFDNLLRTGQTISFEIADPELISVVELVVDAEGKGSGTAMPAVQVELDQETVEDGPPVPVRTPE